MKIYTVLQDYEIDGYYEASGFDGNFSSREGAEAFISSLILEDKTEHIKNRKRYKMRERLGEAFEREFNPPVNTCLKSKPIYNSWGVDVHELKEYQKLHERRVHEWKDSQKPFETALHAYKMKKLEWIDDHMNEEVLSFSFTMSQEEIDQEETDLKFSIVENELGE